MAIVLDSNQARFFCEKITKCSKLPVVDVIIPPHVLAELILWGNRPVLEQLYSLKPRLGMELEDVMSALRKGDSDKIRDFRPFYESTAIGPVLNDGLLNGLIEPLTSHKQWAKACKTRNRNFCGSMQSKASEFKKKLKDRQSQGVVLGKQKIASIEEAYSICGDGSDSIIGLFAKNFFPIDGKNKPTATNLVDSYNAIMANPFIGGFLKTILCYIVSFSRMWNHENQNLNFDPQFKSNKIRDDWTDMTISLYATTGDTILTEDKKLRDVINAVYGAKNIVVKKVADFRFD